MKLVDALRTIQAAPADAPPLPLQLACGFTPLHLKTFVAASVQARAPGRKVVVSEGLYGDALGNVERLASLDPPPEAAIVALEWSDFDPRLGLRSLGGWGPADLPDILATVADRARRFGLALERASARVPVRVSLPTLPLPPVSYLPGTRAGAFELGVRTRVQQFGADVAGWANVALVNPQRLDRVSPPDQRLDVAAELASGFPYTIAHASALGDLLARLTIPDPPKKGLITDLDDTLWRGLVGEIGAHGVSWDLDRKSHAHALYQRMLRSLAEAGVLIAVASKNDPAAVAEAFETRAELATLRGHLFPTEVSWGTKSEAVGRILRAWNIGADAVVFVDDSPMELAEVEAAWPGVTPLRFPKESDARVYALLEDLRDLFGKDAVRADDALRLDSLRSAESFRTEASSDPDAFLARADAEITLNFARTPPDPRAFELINKTNQFNLNGRRSTEGSWLAHLADPETFLLAVGYTDKFGPLGTIAAVVGRSAGVGGTLRVDSWVLSCRAFSRRIEHACLKALFERYGTDSIAFDFLPTPRNGPLRAFFADLLGREPDGPFEITRSAFDAACPPLFHRTKELPDG